MLECLFLMGNLFVSDGQLMIAFSAMSHVERSGNLLLVGSGERQDGLDISAYPGEMAIHTILSECAANAQSTEFEFAVAPVRQALN